VGAKVSRARDECKGNSHVMVTNRAATLVGSLMRVERPFAEVNRAVDAFMMSLFCGPRITCIMVNILTE
jgi:hypothetical protein